MSVAACSMATASSLLNPARSRAGRNPIAWPKVVATRSADPGAVGASSSMAGPASMGRSSPVSSSKASSALRSGFGRSAKGAAATGSGSSSHAATVVHS